ncbi:MAG: hypothetical protein IPL92_05085 [Saprospiraceae bacterium]|nr:hypothetical protein [Candidatus Opimibacter iunctus]
MKTILISFFLLSFSIGYSQGVVDTLVIPGSVRYKQIPTCIGAHCQSGQCSVPGVTEGPPAGFILHRDARIGKIRHCAMVCETPGGVCRKMIFTLSSAEAIEQAGKQASKQFGKPLYTKEDSLYVYSWTSKTSDDDQLKIRLEVAADLKSGMMYMHGQE